MVDAPTLAGGANEGGGAGEKPREYQRTGLGRRLLRMGKAGERLVSPSLSPGVERGQIIWNKTTVALMHVEDCLNFLSLLDLF